MELRSAEFLASADRALADDGDGALARELVGAFAPPLRSAAAEAFGDFDALRAHLQRVRRHSLDNLAVYLEQFLTEAEANGNTVHFAGDPETMNRRVADICARHGARRLIKGKSMVTEETGLNAHLAGAGYRVRETDLGEYIIQEAGETPSHIVGPALHKTEAEIRDLFLDRHPLGPRELDSAAAMVAEARQVLRDDFLDADVGIIGANALIAENGYSLLVTNEGNGDLCANLPPVLIVCTTVDRLLPRMTDAMAMLRLLARSTTGQAMTCYTSFYSGPRRDDDGDGPRETHFVLLDNRRSELLASDYSDMLQCIRCGACLNHCPIYVAAGGHAYGWVYPGPMGSVLTPLLTSLEESHLLPNACTACGRCAEVCPANIPLPDLLRDLRREEREQRLSPARWRHGLRLHARLLRHPWLYRRLTALAMGCLALLARRRGRLRRAPLAAGWSSERDFPAPSGSTFMRRYRGPVSAPPP